MIVGVKRKVLGGVVLSLWVVSLGLDYWHLNEDVKLGEDLKQYKIQIQEHEQKAKELTEELNSKSEMIESLHQQMNQLEAENKSLEGVQQTIISSVGYFPSTSERQLLERLVECEAGAESLEGKIAVANVVLNRIKSNEFPDSISGVIYQKNQFEPVVVGIIDNKQASQESIEAVKRAFLGEKVVASDIVNFWASWLDSDNEIWNHVEIVTTIGVHHFGKEWK